jgi:hypothetical protein
MRLPHLSYLLIEWLFQVDEVANPKVARPKDLLRLLNAMHKLQSQAVNLQPEYNAFLALRKLMISQIRSQRPLLAQLNGLTRLYVLMIRSEQANWFEKDFKAAHGLDLNVFFIMSLWLLWKMNDSHVLQYQRILTELCPAISVDEIALFLKIVGARPEELGSLLSSKKDESIKVDAYFAPTILRTKPLLLLETGAVVPDSLLLRQSISDFVLNDFATRNNSAFRDKFTPAFERYTERVISAANQSFVTEGQLERLLKDKAVTSKVCDFIVFDDYGAVFIDAKGIEPNKVEQSSSNPLSLRDKIKKRVSVGTEQCFASAAVCEQYEIIPLPPRERRFSLVVKHQNFYFLNGRKLEEQIYPDFYAALSGQYGAVIPAEHVYFVTIEEFEMMTLLVGKHGVQIADFLDYCVRQDADAKTTVFEMYQHLIAYCAELGIDASSLFDNSTLEAVFDELVGHAGNAVASGTSYWSLMGSSRAGQFITFHQRLASLLGVR